MEPLETACIDPLKTSHDSSLMKSDTPLVLPLQSFRLKPCQLTGSRPCCPQRCQRPIGSNSKTLSAYFTKWLRSSSFSDFTRVSVNKTKKIYKSFTIVWKSDSTYTWKASSADQAVIAYAVWSASHIIHKEEIYICIHWVLLKRD